MVAAPHAHVLAILTRAPSAIGKTRLFKALGISHDPLLLRALLLDTLEKTLLPGIRRVLAVTPASACVEICGLAGEVEVVPQAAGDLGDRMREAMAARFAEGATAVALIGSDLPQLSPDAIATAFDLVSRGRETLVLGPAEDGGYYLVAARRLPDIFRRIEWGSDRVLSQTEEAARRDGFCVERLAMMRDVDTERDLREVVRLGRSPRTAAWLRQFDARG